jgi:UDP-N-acetylmuramyl pentapeptide phosphotransferase/UDP-N-acetylglucosamine-1-phosphate transferase
MNVLLQQMLLAAVLAGVLAVGFTPLVKRLAERFGVVRAPRARDVHQSPTPLWGGLAMFGAFVITVLLLIDLLTGQDRWFSTGAGSTRSWACSSAERLSPWPACWMINMTCRR